MALNWNTAIEKGHEVGKPYIIMGIKAMIKKIGEEVKESGTIVDDLLWADVIESFQIPK